MLEVIVRVLAPVVAVGVFFGLGMLLLCLRVLPFDRRARADRGRFDLPLTTGYCARWRVIHVRMDQGEAKQAGCRALKAIEARDVVDVDPHTTIGWTRMTWRSWGHEVGVFTRAEADGTITMWCCSRPRIATTLVDWGAGERSCAKLAAEVERQLAAADPLPLTFDRSQ